MSTDLKDARWQLAEDLAAMYHLRYDTGNYNSDSKVRDIAADIINLSNISGDLIIGLAKRWQSEEEKENTMGKDPSTPPPAEVRWDTELGHQAQDLVTAHANTESLLTEDKEIKELAQDFQVKEVKEILTQFDEEIVRLDQMKAQVISAKKQLKAAILGG